MIRQRETGRHAAARYHHRSVVRSDLRRQCQEHAVHRSEGTAIDEGGWVDHPHQLDDGFDGDPAFSVYSATKAAVRNLARRWALDLKGTGIRVNVLSPGATATPGLLDGLARAGEQDALIARLIAQTKLGRIGKTRRLPASLYEVLRWRPRPVARCSGLCTTCTWCRRSSTLVSRIESASFYSSGASDRL